MFSDVPNHLQHVNFKDITPIFNSATNTALIEAGTDYNILPVLILTTILSISYFLKQVFNHTLFPTTITSTTISRLINQWVRLKRRNSLASWIFITNLSSQYDIHIHNNYTNCWFYPRTTEQLHIMFFVLFFVVLLGSL